MKIKTAQNFPKIASVIALIVFLSGCYLLFSFQGQAKLDKKMIGEVLSYEKFEASQGAFLTSYSMSGYIAEIRLHENNESKVVSIPIVKKFNRSKLYEGNKLLIARLKKWFGLVEEYQIIEEGFYN